MADYSRPEPLTMDQRTALARQGKIRELQAEKEALVTRGKALDQEILDLRLRLNEWETKHQGCETHNKRGEPKPGRPERLTLLSASAHLSEGEVVVTTVHRYEPWCCTESHELTDAVQAATHYVREREALL